VNVDSTEFHDSGASERNCLLSSIYDNSLSLDAVLCAIQAMSCLAGEGKVAFAQVELATAQWVQFLRPRGTR